MFDPKRTQRIPILDGQRPAPRLVLPAPDGTGPIVRAPHVHRYRQPPRVTIARGVVILILLALLAVVAIALGKVVSR